MIPITIFAGTLVVLLIYLAVSKYKALQSKYELLQAQTSRHDNIPTTSSITHDRLSEMEDQLSGLPNKVLESINGSISNHKGKLAELIAYVNLKATYDKVIPLGNIVDFLGIRFPTETDPGTFDFIDIKNGKSARLSQDQKQLQKLIHGQHIKFLKIQITTDNVTDLPHTGSDPEVQ